jgi:hypothetical protein
MTEHLTLNVMESAPFESVETLDTITEHSLRELSAASALRDLWILGLRGGGFGIAAVCGASGPGTARVLATSRGALRRFAALDTAAGFLRDLDVLQFSVDVTHHEPGRVRRPRPDRSEALKRTRTSLKQGSLLL